MRLAALFSCMALCGCVTVGSSTLQSREPVATFHTSKSPGELIRCLTQEVRSYGEPSVVPTDRQTTLTFTYLGTAQLIFGIQPSGDVRVWRVTSLVRYQSAVEACR